MDELDPKSLADALRDLTERATDSDLRAVTQPTDTNRLWSYLVEKMRPEDMEESVVEKTEKPSQDAPTRSYHVETSRVRNPNSPTGYSISIKQIFE
jgi:hypothetical protein